MTACRTRRLWRCGGCSRAASSATRGAGCGTSAKPGSRSDEKTLADEPGTAAPGAASSWLARAFPWAVAAGALALAAWALSQTGAGTPATQPVVHLDVAFPPGVEPMGGRQGGIAIAPDGSTIAMVGFKDGQRRLFVRRLDAPGAVDLTGTSGGGVFSPDSASVAVVSNATAVSRVSLADGRFTTLATGGDFVSGVNLAWGPKDVFFVRNGTIWSVPAEGGTARQLTSLDRRERRGAPHRSARAPRRTPRAFLAAHDRARRRSNRGDPRWRAAREASSSRTPRPPCGRRRVTCSSRAGPLSGRCLSTRPLRPLWGRPCR